MCRMMTGELQVRVEGEIRKAPSHLKTRLWVPFEWNGYHYLFVVDEYPDQQFKPIAIDHNPDVPQSRHCECGRDGYPTCDYMTIYYKTEIWKAIQAHLKDRLAAETP